MNPFSLFGGVPQFTQIRDGELRCQGSFRHPIIAGTFGAVNFIFIMTLWFKDKKFRPVIIMGIIASIIVTLTTSSSGPFLALGIGLIGLFCWKLRKKTYIIKRGIIYSLIILEIAMKPPIWYIFAKLSGLVGGTGWHRSYLINQFVHYFREWFLIGTNYTAHWMNGLVLRANPNMVDITNWYIGEGVNGGLLTLILFIYVIVLSFRAVGIAMKKNEDKSIAIQSTIWLTGVTLVVHCMSISSTSYFDQIIVYWYMNIAIIANYVQTYNITFKENKQLKRKIKFSIISQPAG